MQCLLVYDIPDDGKRQKIADACLDYGLDRIQYSAFLGPLLPTHREELMLKVKKILGRKAGNIQLFPLCEKDWEARVVIAQGGQDAGRRD
ncbi:MAG: CRISPR-associated endonuclease Cas2 [Chloroflexi bacterium]|nr:CRISPR-associated endonuclease Cas2 [Chloroflexota bacterium]